MTIRSWPIPNGKILADQTMAALILGAERLPVRTAAELEVARSRLFHACPGSERATAVNHLVDAYQHHTEAAVEALLARASETADTQAA